MENPISYFAELDENNVVKRVLCLDTIYLLDDDGTEQEELGIQKMKEITSSDLKWKRCWMDANRDLSKRFDYPSMGSFYDENLDIFYGLPLEREWVFDTETLEWKPPIDSPPKPSITQQQIDDGYVYLWSYRLYAEGENPWVLRFVRPLMPALTEAELAAKSFYFWEEENKEWKLCTPVGEHPELTEEQINQGYVYHWDENAYRDGQSGWCLVQA